MDQNLYHSLAQRASDLVDAGQLEDALHTLEQLVASDLPDFDRAMMCVNLATVYDKLDRPEDALTAYARALDFERQTDGHFAAQSRAAYFAKLGRYDESLRSYQDLLRRPDLSADQRRAYESNVATLQRLR